MSPTVSISDLSASVAAANTLADAARAMRGLTRLVGADRYLLLDAPQEHAVERTRVVASDWPRDAIEIIGLEAIARLGAADMPVAIGAAAAPENRMGRPDIESVLGPDHAQVLIDFGFGELLSARVCAGLSRGLLVVAARTRGAIDLDAAPAAQILCCYLWSKLNSGHSRHPLANPLSERERECLLWVSEGKTTDEVAMILDVSANTVNRYILHATQKLSASNRVMAIAIAIRNGLI